MSDLESIYAEVIASEEVGGDIGSDPVVDNPIEDVVDDSTDEVVETSDTVVDNSVEDVDGGAVESDVSDSDSSPWDWSAYKDQLVEVSVGGQAAKVPLSEMVSGYMRQADYTRKTQALSEQRQLIDWANEFRQEFAKDPVAVIEDMARAVGYQFPQPRVEANDWDEIPENTGATAAVTATQRQLAEMESRMSQMQEQMRHEQLVSEIKSEIRELQGLFPDFDPNAVLPIAANRGLPLEEAYTLWKASQLVSEQKQRAEAEKAAAAKAQREAAKRAASESVTKGSSRKVAADADDSDFSTFGEMLEAAFAGQ